MNIDVFAIAGQSNAVGQGTGGPSLPSGTAWQYYGGVLSTLAGDPVGNATYGSAWPSFARRWFALTGRPVCFVPCAVDGSALLAAADAGFGNWSAAGTLFNTMVAAVGAALSALSSSGFDPLLRGVLWSQGEQDAVAIDAGTVTAAAYQTALGDLATRMAATWPFAHLFAIQTGTRTGVSDTPYSQVRAAQQSVAFVAPNLHLIHQGAAQFPGLGWLVSGSDVHYAQAGLNDIGLRGAQAIATGTCFNHVFNRAGQSIIGAETNDGADNSFIGVVGGGWRIDLPAFSDRGAGVFMYGNEFGVIGYRGRTMICAGNPGSPTGYDGCIIMRTGNNTINMAITPGGLVILPQGLPTSPAGLPSGTLWRNGTAVNIVP